MSEIYAPGSIAGPQGPAGPAGSQGSVTALASSLLPALGNLYDPSKVISASVVNAADGSLTIGGQSTNVSPLMYCPGATSMISNGTVNAGNWGGGICLYDANGNFISALSTGGTQVNPGVAFALPGTQVYVRWGHVPSWDGVAESAMMCYATTTGTATLPGSYHPAGLDTVADVNAKDAVVAANAAAALVSTVAEIGSGLGLFAHTMLPAPDGGLRNAVDVSKALQNTVINPDGSKANLSGWLSELVFAPGATQFITNLPIRCQGLSAGITAEICTYDAFGNFLAAVGSTAPNSIPAGLIAQNHVYALPGNQTYVGFTWNRGNYGWGPDPNGKYYCSSDASALFIVGNTANPCPASLPQGAPVAGSPFANVKTATQLGAANDGTVDCAALLNAFLATASSTNPIKLILDGKFALSTGLVISPNGNTTIEGIGYGSGLAVTGAAVNAITVNSAGEGAYNVTPPARSATGIVLRDFSVGGIGLSNCANALVDNVNFTQAPSYALTISNANNITVTRSTFASAGTLHDGIHVDGKCEDILISDCYFATGDDAIALNAPEGYGGDISRVTVTNCIFDHSLTVMRIYTSIDAAAMPSNNVHKVRNVVVSNCTGTTNVQCFNLGITNGGLSATTDVDQIQDLSVSNCTLSSPIGLAFMLTPIGAASFHAVKFIPTSAAPVIQVWPGFCFGEIELDGVTVLRNPDGNSTPVAFVQVLPSAAVDRLSLLNCRVVDEEGSSYAALPSLVDVAGTVAVLRLESVDLTHITTLASSAGWNGVTLLRGGGVLGSGVQVPDSLMDANTLYLSSTAGGAASIKIGGTAKRLTLA